MFAPLDLKAFDVWDESVGWDFHQIAGVLASTPSFESIPISFKRNLPSLYVPLHSVSIPF